jgi:LysR family transcriptional regulator (chromosome initiation inhibitor)
MFLHKMKFCFTSSMRFDPAQLETLAAIVEEGSFEGAARRLHLTPSAVSQRVRALEGAAGQVLVRRTLPAEVTPAGTPLLRLARQLRLLTAEAGVELGHDDVVELRVAVNADSLATWFRAVLADIAMRPDTVLRLVVEDEAHSHELLRSGEALAAVTAEPTPVQGCSVEPLGAMRYRAAVAPWLLAEHQRGTRVDWASIPMVVFNEKDQLQDTVLTARRASRPRVVHRVPSTADFLEAVRTGMGWGLVPLHQLTPELARGDLARMPGAGPVDVDLFWQRWRLASPALDTLTSDVRAAARSSLRAPSRSH